MKTTVVLELAKLEELLTKAMVQAVNLALDGTLADGIVDQTRWKILFKGEEYTGPRDETFQIAPIAHKQDGVEMLASPLRDAGDIFSVLTEYAKLNAARLKQDDVQILYTLRSWHEAERAIPISIHLVRGNVSIKMDGYGTHDSQDGHGVPIFLEVSNNDPQLVLFSDINQQDPEVVRFSKARESNRDDEWKG